MTTAVAQHAAELLDAFCGPLRTRAATPADALTIEPARELLDADSATRAEALIQAIELLCPPKGWLTRLGLGKARNVGPAEQHALRLLIARLLRSRLDLDEAQLDRALSAAARDPQGFALSALLSTVTRHLENGEASDKLRPALAKLRDALDSRQLASAEDKRRLRSVEILLAQGDAAAAPEHAPADLFGDVGAQSWSAEVESWHGELEPAAQEAWRALFAHAEQAAGKSKPTKRWLGQAVTLVEGVGVAAYVERLSAWTAEVPLGWTSRGQWQPKDVKLGISDVEQDRLKGLLWAASGLADGSLAHAIGRFGERCFRKIKDFGPASTRLGNACVVVLGLMPEGVGVPMLSRLAAKTRYGSARTQIDRALLRAAEAAGQTRADLEELAVPDFGLRADGAWRLKVGDGEWMDDDETFFVELSLGEGDKLEATWLTPEGRSRKAPPKELRDRHPEALKATKATLKELGDLLEGQALRLQRLYLEDRRLPLGELRARYLDHPVISRLARRLLWTVRRPSGEELDVCWRAGALVTLGGQPVVLDDESDEGRLWHPLDAAADLERLQVWRDDFEMLGIRQPFKQLWREVYAPARASDGSADGDESGDRRFAGQIVRQHPLRNLCQQRGWQYTIQGHWDSHNWPTRALPRHGLVAQLQVDPLGHDDDDYIFNYLVTGELSFFAADEELIYTDRRVPLAEIPPLVFSELLRDVDLFIGVGTVATDPDFDERSLDPRWLAPWQSASWGDLAPTAKTRRDVLARVLPRTTLRDKAVLEERELIVTAKDGQRYRIHLGSASVRRAADGDGGEDARQTSASERVDVPLDRRAKRQLDEVFLPFEGDSMLKTILAKAFALAG